jgi:alkanesulfonate monooxygenase
MRIEFTADVSELDILQAASRKGHIDSSGLTLMAREAEAAGVDRLLIADPTGSQDVAALAAHILHATSTLNVEVQHSAGAVSPEIAARQIATLDQLSGGRVTVHIDPSGSGGAVLSHEDNLARLDEYIMLLKRLWTNDEPIDHEGGFHRLEGAFSGPKPFRDGHVPIAVAGLSGTAIKVAARHADVFALPAATIDEARRTIERVRAAAARHRRAETIRFSFPIRAEIKSGEGAASAKPPVAAPPDVEAFAAWLDAQHIRRATATRSGPGTENQATVISGSVETISLAILDYCDIGVTDFSVRGLRSAAEISAFGRLVAPLVRRALAHRRAGASEQLPFQMPSAAWRRYPV